jgi:hypothetical protein
MLGGFVAMVTPVTDWGGVDDGAVDEPPPPPQARRNRAGITRVVKSAAVVRRLENWSLMAFAVVLGQARVNSEVLAR